jgi:myo-inositol-1-phosphate synthase
MRDGRRGDHLDRFQDRVAVRCCKLALDHGLSGALEGPSAYFMKSPPLQYSDNDAHRLTEALISDFGRSDRAAVTEESPTIGS